MDRTELIVAALKEQISALSLENAILRADMTLLVNEKRAKEKEESEYSKSLEG